MFKKIIGMFTGCLLLILLGVFQIIGEPFDRLLTVMFTPTPVEETTPLESNHLKTDRVIPQNVNWGAFLSGKIAQQNKDYLSTQKYMQQVLQTDPHNNNLKELVYIISGFNGDIETMAQLAREDHIFKDTRFFAPYVLIAQQVKLKNYQKALSLIQQSEEKPFIDSFIIMLKIWCYAGLNDEKKAFETLNLLNKKELLSLYKYQKALLNEFFNHPEAAKQEYLKMNLKDIPSLNVLISLKSFFEKQNQWNFLHPHYEAYQEIMKQSPTLHDALVQTKTRPIQTAQDGVAEAYYEISVALYDNKLTDQALLYNNMARYLSDDLLLYKIYGARLYEILQLYPQANALYESIGANLDIVKFKKALNALATDDSKTAQLLLEDLAPRNQGNVLIQSLLGQVYFIQKNYQKALASYNKALSLVKKDADSDLAMLYFERAKCYYELDLFNQFQIDMLQVLKLEPDNAEALNYLGYEWVMRDMNLKEALTFIQKADKITPNRPHILDSLAMAYYKNKDYQKALHFAERAVDEMGASSVANMHLGDIYQALGRKREARSQYEKALALKLDLTADIKKELEQKLSQ